LGIPVITATQMLQQVHTESTRAKVSDGRECDSGGNRCGNALNKTVGKRTRRSRMTMALLLATWTEQEKGASINPCQCPKISQRFLQCNSVPLVKSGGATGAASDATLTETGSQPGMSQSSGPATSS